MTEKDEKLLLQDLCARLPYGVKINLNGSNDVWTLKGIFEGDHTGVMLILEPSFPSKDVSPQTSNWQLSQCKPYLRPMSSMTEEEYNEVGDLLKAEDPNLNLDEVMATIEIDWLNKKMFDFRELIPKDLALSIEKLNSYVKD